MTQSNRHARKATSVAKGLGARFREIDTAKANLHAWLAWQKNPGRPYGVAVRSEYFGHDSPEARAFVGWFRPFVSLGDSQMTVVPGGPAQKLPRRSPRDRPAASRRHVDPANQDLAQRAMGAGLLQRTARKVLRLSSPPYRRPH